MILFQDLLLLLFCYYCLLLLRFALMQNKTKRSYEIMFNAIHDLLPPNQQDGPKSSAAILNTVPYTGLELL